MKARDIMTRDVLSASPTTAVNDIAALLLARRISAVPIIDPENHVLGIVSEGDLLHRKEAGTERRRSWWLELITDTETLAREYVKSAGLKAADVMTQHVVSVTEDTEVADIADLLEARKIKRVPVVRAGKLVGIVSRADLLQALARGERKAPEASAPDDRSIHDALRAKLREARWADAAVLNTVVRNGIVEFWGYAGSPEQRRALRVLAESVAGVRAVEEHLIARMVAAV